MSRQGFRILLLFTATIASAEAKPVCINTRDKAVPACPAGDPGALDETFPAAFITVSPGQESQTLGPDFAEKAFLAGGSTRIVLSGWPESLTRKLFEKLKGLGYKEKEIRARILPAPRASDYQWQQDYFKSEIDPRTGLPRIRPIRDYLGRRMGIGEEEKYLDDFSTLLNGQKLFCEGRISRGDPLPREFENGGSIRSGGYFGGNMQKLPGGACLVGDSLPPESFRDFCRGNPGKAIVLPTKWLFVGHADELVSVVRDSSARAPCDYAVLRASPKKALELLEKAAADPEAGKKKFGNLGPDDRNTFTEVCDSYYRYSARTRPNPSPSPPDAVRGGWNLPGLLFPDPALAGDFFPIPANRDCRTLSQAEAWSGIRNNADLEDVNLIIEEQLSAVETQIRKAAAEQGCPSIRILPVPNLFRGTVVSSKAESPEPIEATLNDGRILKKPASEFTEDEMNRISSRDRIRLFGRSIAPGSGYSLHPNPTNSVLLQNTLLLSDPKNDLYADYLKTGIAEPLGLHPVFVDTWRDAHAHDGNLHCSTNAFRYCRPVEAAK